MSVFLGKFSASMSSSGFFCPLLHLFSLSKINGLDNNILLFARDSMGQAGLSKGFLWLRVAWASSLAWG